LSQHLEHLALDADTTLQSHLYSHKIKAYHFTSLTNKCLEDLSASRTHHI
jgi:hypothetical protein